MLRTIIFLSLSAALVSSCCQPSHRNSNPVMVDSLFQVSYGRDIDLVTADSAYYPVYTFGIQNTGTEEDKFTLQLFRTAPQGFTAGFAITRTVPAGATVLFRTPTLLPDSITSQETFSYYATGDTLPNIDQIYVGLSFRTSDSAAIQQLQPSLSIVYGEINNGPEGCNTPASSSQLDVNALPVR